MCAGVLLQAAEASLSDLLLQQMELATPVMAYVYGEDESKDELTLLAAIENSGKQEDTKNADIEISADAQKANGDEEETGIKSLLTRAENSCYQRHRFGQSRQRSIGINCWTLIIWSKTFIGLTAQRRSIPRN